MLHVVLVLPYADRLRVNLHELRERVLYAARNRGRTALSHIELRELLGRERTRGVDRSARLVRDHIGDLLREFF